MSDGQAPDALAGAAEPRLAALVGTPAGSGTASRRTSAGSRSVGGTYRGGSVGRDSAGGASASASQLGEDEREWPEWVEVQDEDLGLPYYFNTITGESLWEKPAAMVEQEAFEARRAEGDLDVMAALQQEQDKADAPPPRRFQWAEPEDLPPPPAHRGASKVYGSVLASKGAALPRFAVLGVPASSLVPAVPIRPLPHRSGALFKRGGRGAFGRRWQRRWFVLQGRVLRYYKQPQAHVQHATDKMESVARDQLAFYSSRGRGAGAAEAKPRGGASGAGGAGRRGIQSEGAEGLDGTPDSSAPGSFASPAGAAEAAASLRASGAANGAGSPSAKGSGNGAQGSHAQRAALESVLAAAKVSDSPLRALPLYGGWIRDVADGFRGARAHSFLLLAGEGAKVYELAAASEGDKRAWILALCGAGCRMLATQPLLR